jgi:thiol-disulfide isomerase/thioredoxin
MRILFFVGAFLALLVIASIAFVGRFAIIPNTTYQLRVELDTGEQPISFLLNYFRDEESNQWRVHSRNGGLDRLGSVGGESVEVDRQSLRVEYPHFDSVLEISDPDGDGRWSGTWSKDRGSSGVAVLQATAEQAPAQQFNGFEPIKSESQNADFSGRWSVHFKSSDDPAIGVFEISKLDPETITGTFLTTTGDYRYLAGRVDGDLMRLSTFDGAHAFLFHARMQPDGTIQGDFWSGNWHHETWTATRDPDALLPDMFAQTTVADADALDDLTFKALDGTPTKVIDLLDATAAPARVLYVFGTWCPNCADAAAELKRLKDLHGDNLGVVGLAFELTDDHERSATQVRRYLERHGGTWPILIAGLSDKSKASAELPILDKVRSYPTTIFLNSANEIVSVHTGFTGPATGEAFSDQQREYERIITELIAAKP